MNLGNKWYFQLKHIFNTAYIFFHALPNLVLTKSHLWDTGSSQAFFQTATHPSSQPSITHSEEVVSTLFHIHDTQDW